MRRHLRAVGASSPRDEVEPLVEDPKVRRALIALLRPLAPVLAELVRPHLGATRAERDHELVDVLVAVPGPRRSLLAACRRGELAGATKVGRRWLAPRASLEAWLRARGPRAVTRGDNAGDEDLDQLDDLRAALAGGGR